MSNVEDKVVFITGASSGMSEASDRVCNRTAERRGCQ